MKLHEKIRKCKLPPLTRKQKILRNLILILLAVCILIVRSEDGSARTTDAALERALHEDLGILQPYEILADYTLPENMSYYSREVSVRTTAQGEGKVVMIRILKSDDRYFAEVPWMVSEAKMRSDAPLDHLAFWEKQPEADRGIYHLTCPENFPQLGTHADVKFEPDCGDGRVRVMIDRLRTGSKPDDHEAVEALYGIELPEWETAGDYFADFDADLVYTADLSREEKAEGRVAWEYIRPEFKPGGYTEEGLVLSDADALRLAKMLDTYVTDALRDGEIPYNKQISTSAVRNLFLKKL